MGQNVSVGFIRSNHRHFLPQVTLLLPRHPGVRKRRGGSMTQTRTVEYREDRLHFQVLHTLWVTPSLSSSLDSGTVSHHLRVLSHPPPLPPPTARGSVMSTVALSVPAVWPDASNEVSGAEQLGPPLPPLDTFPSLDSFMASSSSPAGHESVSRT